MTSNRKFIFIHISKTGGSSIHKMIEDHKKQNNIPPECRSAHRFMDADSEVDGLTKRVDVFYADYYKFAFVRNPWARIASGYYHQIQEKRDKDGNFANFIKRIQNPKISFFYRTQFSWIAPYGSIGVDFVGRYENYEKDLDHVCDILGMENTVKTQNIRTLFFGKYNYKDFYTPALVEKVRVMYEEDIDFFGYKF